MKVLNTAYVRDEGRCFGPVMFPGETYKHIINLINPTSDLSFDDWELHLLEADGITLVNNDVGSLFKIPLTDAFYKIRFEMLCPPVAFGTYKLGIYDPTGATYKAISSVIIIEEPEVVKNTAFVAFRNTTNLYYFDYELLPADYYNTIRLPLIQIESKIEEERKQYRNVTNRRVRNLKNYKDTVITVESYYFDGNGHEAMAAIYDHDDVRINDIMVVAKDAYTIEARQNSVLSKAKIDLYIDVANDPNALNLITTPEFSDEFN
jgi:hypothetical protein